MSLSGNITLLADRIADEFNQVRTEFAATVFVTQAEYDAIGTPDPDTLYIITDGDASDVQSGSGTGTITVNYALGSMYDHTATGSVTFNAPTNGVNRRPLRIAVLASGAQRTVTFASTIRLSTGLSARSFDVPSGQVLLAALEWSSLISAWVLTAATVSAT